MLVKSGVGGIERTFALEDAVRQNNQFAHDGCESDHLGLPAASSR